MINTRRCISSPIMSHLVGYQGWVTISVLRVSRRRHFSSALLVPVCSSVCLSPRDLLEIGNLGKGFNQPSSFFPPLPGSSLLPPESLLLTEPFLWAERERLVGRPELLWLGSKFPRFRVCLIGAFGSPINPSSYRRASLSTDVSLVLYLLFVLFIMLNREDGWYLLELWYRW